MSHPGSGAGKLASASLIYGLGSVVTRGLAFLLLPIYTRSLSPTDYGIVAVSVTVSSILGVLFPLGLHGAVARLHFGATSEGERRRIHGTLWLAIVVSSFTMAALADFAGAPLAAWALPRIPFEPFLRIAIWSAFFTALGLVPLALFQIREQPRHYVALSVGASLLTTAGVVLFAVLWRGGARGYLLGTLVGSALAAVAHLAVAMRIAPPAVDRTALAAALRYSLPIVPHSLAGWALELSDRAILARFVPLAEVGLYGIGYQLGAALGTLTAAFTNAWMPVLFAGLAKGDAESERQLARVQTYFVVTLVFCALGWALLAPQLISILLAPGFHSAYRVTHWIIGAQVLSGLYILPIGLLFWRQSTWPIPVVTVTAAACNVGLNLLLLPRYGFMAAAWSTFACYAIMVAIAWAIARRHRRFPYEYGQIAAVLLLATLLYGLGSLATPALTLGGVAVRLMAWGALLPALAAAGVLGPRERTALMTFLRRLAGPLGGGRPGPRQRG